MTDSGSVVGVTGHTPSALEPDRRAFRRGRERRSVLMAVASTLVFAAIVWVTVINTPGWTKVQETFFDPATAWEALPKVWDGFLLNLTVLGISVFTVAIVALLVAVLRTLRGPVFFPVRVLAAAYTDFLKLVIDNPDLKLRSPDSTRGLTPEQQDRMRAMFEILTSLFERAYLLTYEEKLTGKKLRRWLSWEDFMREWVRRDDFRESLPAMLPGEDPELAPDALHQVDALVEDLIDAGFDPLVDERELTIDLTPCAQATAARRLADWSSPSGASGTSPGSSAATLGSRRTAARWSRCSPRPSTATRSRCGSRSCPPAPPA